MTSAAGSGAARGRALVGPLGMAAAITTLAATGVVTAVVLPGGGWLLAWLALGLAAGYALSGSV